MIRVATHDDISEVLGVWAQARSVAAVTPDTPEAVQRLLERSPGSLLVAVEGGAIVGVLIAAWDGWRGNLYRLAVLTGSRRRGIGRALVEAGHAQLRAQGARRVSALVGADDDVAIALWTALGYERDVEIARVSRDL